MKTINAIAQVLNVSENQIKSIATWDKVYFVQVTVGRPTFVSKQAIAPLLSPKTNMETASFDLVGRAVPSFSSSSCRDFYFYALFSNVQRAIAPYGVQMQEPDLAAATLGELSLLSTQSIEVVWLLPVAIVGITPEQWAQVQKALIAMGDHRVSAFISKEDQAKMLGR